MRSLLRPTPAHWSRNERPQPDPRRRVDAVGPLGRAWRLGDAGDVVVELRRGCLQNEASTKRLQNEATTVPWYRKIPNLGAAPTSLRRAHAALRAANRACCRMMNATVASGVVLPQSGRRRAVCFLYNATGCWLDALDVEAYRARLQSTTSTSRFVNLTETIQRSEQNPFCPEWDSVIEKHCHKAHGKANSIIRLGAQDAATLGLTTNGGVLRVSGCYRNVTGRVQLTVEGAMLAFHLGELGIGPQIHASWIDNPSCSETGGFRLPMVAEPYMPLSTLLSLTNGAHSAVRGSSGMSLDQELVGHVRGIAQLGGLFLDLHEANALVRPSTHARLRLQSGNKSAEEFASLAWESRLTDFDRLFFLTAHGVDRDCLQLAMLSLLSMRLACSGIAPRVAFRDEIIRLAAMPSVQADGCAAALGVRVPNQTNPVPKAGVRPAHVRPAHYDHHAVAMFNRHLLKIVPSRCRSMSLLQRRWQSGLQPL